MASSNMLLVWDFDWSLINENTDTFVVQQLDPSGDVWRRGKQKMQQGVGWTELMDWALGELCYDRPALDAALSAIPITDGARRAVQAACAAGAEQRILSDANSHYIATVLAAHGHADAFTRIETNPAEFADGRLRVRPHQPDGAPHGSALCPPNLCKGTVLDRWIAELQPARVIYVGDGSGDYCPATRLRPGDVLLARRAPHDGLLKKCRANPAAVRAEVVEWDDADGGASLLAGIERALSAAVPEGVAALSAAVPDGVAASVG